MVDSKTMKNIIIIILLVASSVMYSQQTPNKIIFVKDTAAGGILDNKFATNEALAAVSSGASDGVLESVVVDGANQEVDFNISAAGTDIFNVDFSAFTTDAEALLAYEAIFSKNTAFNKNFGTIAGTVLEGNADLTADDLSDNDTDDLAEGVTNKYYPSADASKLSGIEPLATADQTGAEIKALYEAEANAYTDAKDTKLTGIETSATADQTAAEIRTLVESASDSNVFTDADHSKLNGIESNATADQTDEEIQDIVGGMVTGNTESGITVTYQDIDGTLDFSVASQTDNNFTTTLKNKLDGIEASATADQTGAEIKALYEAEANAYTDALNTKLTGIETSAKDDQSALEVPTALTPVNWTPTGNTVEENLVGIDATFTTLGTTSHAAATISATNNAGGRLTITGQEINLTDFVEVDGSTTNEVQTLTKIGNQLDISIDAGTPIDLSEYRQTLNDVLTQGQSAGAKILNLTLGTNSTDAANVQNVTDAVAASDALDLDRDTTNELQTLSLSGLSLLLDDSDGVIQNTINLSDFAEGLENVSSQVSVVGTGSALTGNSDVHYTKVRTTNGELYEVSGIVFVVIAGGNNTEVTVKVNPSYAASFENITDAKGVCNVWAGSTAYRPTIEANTSTNDIELKFTPPSDGTYEVQFKISYNK